jgi:pimeloyl-ACP methyl ester carboxylesterase
MAAMQNFTFLLRNGRTLRGLVSAPSSSSTLSNAANPPLLLFLHGWLDNANSFAPLLENLSPATLSSHRCLALDLCGHGLSDHKTDQYYMNDSVLDILELITTQRGDQKVTLIGHSLGAGIASICAGTAPHLIEKVVLLDGIGRK